MVREIAWSDRLPMSRIGGIFTEPRFVGSAQSDGVEMPSIGTAALTADFDASARALNATNIDATVGRVDASPATCWPISTPVAWQGSCTVEAPSAADVLTAVPEALRLQGPLSATATLGGTVDESRDCALT